MKRFFKSYLFIIIFAVILTVSGCVNAANTVTNSSSDNTSKNTTNSATNSTTNKAAKTTTKTTTKTTKSNNAYLSTLGVTPKEYDFSGFSKTKTSYSVTVPSSVNALKVSYKTEDPKAKVTVTGSNSLEVGTNTIKVIVTASDGKTKKTYTIKVTKLATEDSKPGNLIDETDSTDLYLSSLKIKGLELTPEFSKDVFSYEATIDMDTNDMSEVKVEAKSDDKSATIEVTGNKGLQEGENIINVIVKSPNSSEQTVYQVTVNKTRNVAATSGKKIRKEHLIIGAYVATLVIIFTIIFIKRKKNKDYYDDYEDESYDDNNFRNNYNENTNDNFIEDLYKRRNDGERLNKFEEETIDDIEKENDRIFNKPKKGATIEYDEQNEDIEDNDFRERRRGKHF